MKVIALMPVRNEAWIIRHSLACLSTFCDVILVNDQNSEDATADICRQFPKVHLIESPTADVCEVGRWRLLDAARDHEGQNLLWCTDADELVSPALFRKFLSVHRDHLAPGTVVEALFYHLWESPRSYRDDGSPYSPYWKQFGLVDDRKTDFDRSPRLPLHQPRVPLGEGQPTLRSDEIRVLHLQWLLAEQNQIKQAWYRCREWLDGKSAAEVNERYSITLPAPNARTSELPAAWTEGLTLPDLTTDSRQTWQEREIVGWFDYYGAEFFEPLEIWHITPLERIFEDRVGRRPRPAKSYRPAFSSRAKRFARLVANGARGRFFS
jgi:Glycosyl transferase family 2